MLFRQRVCTGFPERLRELVPGVAGRLLLCDGEVEWERWKQRFRCSSTIVLTRFRRSDSLVPVTANGPTNAGGAATQVHSLDETQSAEGSEEVGQGCQCATRVSSGIPLTPQAIRKVGHRYEEGGLLYEKRRLEAAALLENWQGQSIIAIVYD